jgi:hypothetical protein
VTADTPSSIWLLLWKHRWVYLGVMLFLFFVAQTLYYVIIGSLGVLPWALLLVMSLVGAHIIFTLSYRADAVDEKVHTHVRSKSIKDQDKSLRPLHQHETINEPLYSSTSTQDEIEQQIQLKAQQEGVLVSEDCIKIIANSKDSALSLLDNLIKRVQRDYQKVDGWTVLDKERIETIQSNTESAMLFGQVKDSRTQKADYIPMSLANGSLHSRFETHIRALITLLKEDNEQSLFEYIGAHAEGDTEWSRKLLAETALALDNVYRHRIYGTGYVDSHLLQEVHDFSDIELEHLITILSTGVDYRYDTIEVEPKLALLRALQFMEVRKEMTREQV